jgi:hypothetical protein
MNQRSSKNVNRRAFLYGAGTTGLALPFLEGIPERSAFAATDDAAFALFICTANGVVQGVGGESPDHFWPSSVGALTQSSMEADSAQRCTGILSDYADRLLIVRGIDHAGQSYTADTAAAGLAMCLTGLPFSGGSNQATSTGPSADWVVARAAGVDPLTLYAGKKMGYIDERLSFSEAGQVVPAEGDPYQVYLQLAGLLSESGLPTDAALELAQRRQSVNDLVREDLHTLQANPRLSQADRQRLQLHLDAIRDVEVALSSNTCTSRFLDIGTIETIGAKGFIEDVAQLQMQLAGLAFSCNLTRAATLQWGDGVDKTKYVIDGEETEVFSFISNRVQSDGASGTPIPGAVEMHIEIDRIRMRTFKTLLDSWSELTTPRGALLDSALALWTCSKADGPTDSFRDLPIIIAGSPFGRLAQGQFIDVGGVSMARLLTSLIEVCGVDATGFAEGVGGLPDVLA